MEIIKISQQKDIDSYQPSEGLVDIISMARALGRPLLLTGKPGTGKTQFAKWYAKQPQNDFGHDIFQFNTKSTSVYNDLFYEYDAISHFRDKKGEREITDFIKLTALGKAIVCAKGAENISDENLKKIIAQSDLKDLKPRNIVLIDEIDKAPRDFPNDLLYEIENLSFTIKELNLRIILEEEQKHNIVVILTSNDEKNLPDAFLRRCLFHYIEFPTKESLIAIIQKKLDIKEWKDNHQQIIDFFYLIYENKSIDKKPSTSECIDWINFLKNFKDKNGNTNLFDDDYHNDINKFRNSLSILLKKKEDYDIATKLVK
jgi:MoxR-like ATPase